MGAPPRAIVASSRNTLTLPVCLLHRIWFERKPGFVVERLAALVGLGSCANAIRDSCDAMARRLCYSRFSGVYLMSPVPMATSRCTTQRASAQPSRERTTSASISATRHISGNWCPRKWRYCQIPRDKTVWSAATAQSIQCICLKKLCVRLACAFAFIAVRAMTSVCFARVHKGR